MPEDYLPGALVTVTRPGGIEQDGVVVQPWGRRTVRVVTWNGGAFEDSCPRRRSVSRRTAAGPHDARLLREAENLQRKYKRSLGRAPSPSGNAPVPGLPAHSGNRASFWRGRSSGR